PIALPLSYRRTVAGVRKSGLASERQCINWPASSASAHYSVPEVAPACEHHRQTMLVGSRDDLVITHGTTWLEHGTGPCFRRCVKAIAVRVEGVTGAAATPGTAGCLAGGDLG